MGYHPNAFIMGDDVANSALNFLERGWNGENFHEVTENLRSSDPYICLLYTSYSTLEMSSALAFLLIAVL